MKTSVSEIIYVGFVIHNSYFTKTYIRKLQNYRKYMPADD